MAEVIKGFSIELGLDALKVDSGLQDMKKSLRNVSSEMRANMSQFDRSERSMEKYSTQIAGLNKKHELQEHAVENARKKYEEMEKQYGENNTKTIEAATNYNNEVASLQNLERYIGKVTDEMKEFERQQQIQGSTLYKTGEKLTNFGDGLQKVSGKAREVGSALTKRITLPAVGVASAVGGIVASFGWGRLTGLDTAQAQLKGLGYNTEEVGRISDQVTNAIEGGMTTMAEGTAIAAGAMAAGVEEGKDLERYIKLVGDAAVGANRPVDDMAQIFNRVQGSGKLMTQELNMIEQGMPGFAQAMADNIADGSLESFREMVTNGEVGSKEFLDVMEDFAGGMAEAYSDSWQGMLANTKAYIGIIGENLLGGVFEESKESLREFIDILSSDETQKWAEEMGAKIGDVFTRIVNAVKDGIQWFNNLSDSQKSMITKFGAVVVAAGPLITGLGILGGIIGKISSGLGVFMKVLTPIITPLKSVGGAAAASGKSVGLLGTVFSALTGPVGIVIGIIAALATGITIAYKKSETFRNILSKVGEKIQEAFGKVMEFVQPAIDAIKDFFGEIKEKITGFASEEGPQLMDAFGNIGSFIGAIAKDIWTAISNAFTAIKEIVEFVMPFIKEVIKTVWSGIKSIITGALDVIMGVVKVFSGLFTGDFAKMWEGVKQIFSGAIKIVWGFIKTSFVGAIIGAIIGFVKSFKGKITDMWEAIKIKFRFHIMKIRYQMKQSFFGRMILYIIDFVKNFRTKISDMWEKVKSTFKTFIRDIKDRIKNSFVGKMLDSIKTLKDDFISLAGDMWDGVKKKFNDIVDGAKGLPGRIGKAIKNAKSKATDGMKAVGNKLIEWAGKPYNKVIGGVNWIVKKFTGKKNSIDTWDWKAKQYAHGTDGHPGGHAIMGDGKGSNAGSELVRLPDGKQFLSAAKPTLYPNLPKGTRVLPAKLTKQIPMYADGIGSKIWGGVKSLGSKLSKTVGDVWDYVSKPSKLVNKVMNSIGVIKNKPQAPTEMVKAGFNYLKDKPIQFVKDKINEFMASGGGGAPNFGYPITSPFGFRIHPITGLKKLHAGVDFGAPYGADIAAQTSGKVSSAGWRGGYGNTVAIKNGIMEYLYAHMSKILTKKGAVVKKGDIIGKVGSTGNSTGPHIHYEARKNGTPVNPMKLTAGGSGVDRWRALASRALSMTGQFSPANLDRLLHQMKTESGGNPKAINNWDINAKRGTPSKGLMQVIDPTFQAYKMPGYNNIWNPLDNMLASIRYAVSRYGSLSKAYRGVGYATGGLIKNSGLYKLAEGGFPEWVIPTDPARRTDAMKMLALAAKDIDSGNKRPGSLPNIRTDDRTDEIINMMQEQIDNDDRMIDLLMQILTKNSDVYLDGRTLVGFISDIQDRKERRNARKAGYTGGV